MDETKGRMVAALATMLLPALAGGGCATNFYGSAYVPHGPRGCLEGCNTVGLEMAGMVYLGEYSSACVCRVRPDAGAAPTAAAADDDAMSLAVAGLGASVGVVLRMRAAAARQQQQLQQQPALPGVPSVLAVPAPGLRGPP
jgi:hypothetical protein